MKGLFLFIINSIALGIGLAMDAFSVSLANGLYEPDMKRSKAVGIAFTFAFYQWMMPMIGWICVHTILEYFLFFADLIPWIALILLCFIGFNMIKESREAGSDEQPQKKLDFRTLMIQGVATSIDALSVGFTIASYGLSSALVCTIIIGVVTFVICIAGLQLGRKAGMKYAEKATLFGGLLLIGIGIEIFVKNMIGL